MKQEHLLWLFGFCIWGAAMIGVAITSSYHDISSSLMIMVIGSYEAYDMRFEKGDDKND